MGKHDFKLMKHKDNEKKLYVPEFIEMLFNVKNKMLENIDAVNEDNPDETYQFFYRGQGVYFKENEDVYNKPFIFSNTNQAGDQKVLNSGENKLEEVENLPGIFRDGNLSKERIIYNKVKVECSKEFVDCKSHLDVLTKMQHYGVPTRLLDVTGNALTALYFACNDGIKKQLLENINNDENKFVKVVVYCTQTKNIKFPNSDTVSILSSLPLMNSHDLKEIEDTSYELIRNGVDKSVEFKNSLYADMWKKDIFNEFNENVIIKKLVHEVRNEKPGFENKIVPHDILKRFIVLSEKKNSRMIMQDGAFIIFGLYYPEIKNQDKEILKKYSLEDNISEMNIYIDQRCCVSILKELKDLGIKTSTVYPEMDRVAEELKNK